VTPAGAALSGDATLLVLCGDHPEIRRLSAASAAAQASSLRLGPGRLAHGIPALAQDGALLATASSDPRRFIVWRTRDATIVRDVKLTEPLASLALGSRAAVARASGGRLLAVPIATGAPRPLRGGDGHRVRALAVTGDGRWALSGGAGGDLCLWDVESAALVDRVDLQGALDGHAAAVTSVAFAPGAALAASGSDDRTIRLWTIAAKPA
jgi:WD40 repeat protein